MFWRENSNSSFLCKICLEVYRQNFLRLKREGPGRQLPKDVFQCLYNTFACQAVKTRFWRENSDSSFLCKICFDVYRQNFLRLKGEGPGRQLPKDVFRCLYNTFACQAVKTRFTYGQYIILNSCYESDHRRMIYPGFMACMASNLHFYSISIVQAPGNPVG